MNGVKPSPLQNIWLGIPASVRGLIRTMRPRQWAKNGFVFAGILFDRQLGDPEALARVLVAFGMFSLMASGVYLMNDLVDIERDRLHPKKKYRPLPSGQLPLGMAKVAAVCLLVISVVVSVVVSPGLAAVLMSYAGLQVAYSFVLKNIVILDVFSIAAGFVLRTIAGIVVIDVTNFSPWLYVCAGLLSLFLAIGKRRQELILLQNDDNNSDVAQVRDTFKGYNLPLLDDLLRMVVTAVAIAYTLYATEAETILVQVNTEFMLLTVPVVYYGLFRYLYVIHRLNKGGDPTEVLFEDQPLQVSIGVWVAMVIVLLYVVG